MQMKISCLKQGKTGTQAAFNHVFKKDNSFTVHIRPSGILMIVSIHISLISSISPEKVKSFKKMLLLRSQYRTVMLLCLGQRWPDGLKAGLAKLPEI